MHLVEDKQDLDMLDMVKQPSPPKKEVVAPVKVEAEEVTPFKVVTVIENVDGD